MMDILCSRSEIAVYPYKILMDIADLPARSYQMESKR